MNICSIIDCETNLMPLIESDQQKEVEGKPKLKTYKLFKTNFGTSDYVINVLNVKDTKDHCQQELVFFN